MLSTSEEHAVKLANRQINMLVQKWLKRSSKWSNNGTKNLRAEKLGDVISSSEHYELPIYCELVSLASSLASRMYNSVKNRFGKIHGAIM